MEPEQPATIPMRFWQKIGCLTWVQVNADYPPPQDPKDRRPASVDPPKFDFFDRLIAEVMKPPHIPRLLIHYLRESLFGLHRKIDVIQKVIAVDGAFESSKFGGYEDSVLFHDAFQTARGCINCVPKGLGKASPIPSTTGSEGSLGIRHENGPPLLLLIWMNSFIWF